MSLLVAPNRLSLLCRATLIVAATLLLSASLACAAALNAEDAAGHVGETATICGVVASAKFAPGSRSQPTFLDFGKPYPDAAFTAVIFGDDQPKFGTPETSLRGKRICVTGQVRDYRGKPEIILHDPSQLSE
jgi:DNA/RNA endonuclease YhcR with UshA esterase domain